MKTWACLALAVGMSGCAVPGPVITRVGARGVVIDARTRRPVSRVVVDLDGAPLAGVVTWSGDDGAFLVSGATTIGLRRIGHRPPVAESTLTFTRAGYHPYRLFLRAFPTYTEKGAVLNVGTVALQPGDR